MPAPLSPPRPVIITGMHRSGTSLAASFLGALGIHLGDRLLLPDRLNPRGYFEDADFVELQWRMLEEATPAGDGGHRDWGWTESERLDRGRFPRHAEAARGLVAARAGRPGLWGWKDPRTTVLLDFWDEILAGHALYVLLYRFPWEVADSIQRMGGGEFLDNPEYAFRIWAFYNRQLLDFHRRHADRCVLASANALVRDAGRFVELLRGKLGLPVGDAPLDSVWQRDLFVSFPPDDPLVSLTAATSPECGRLLAELDAAADLPATGLWNAAPLRGERLRPAGPVDLSVVIPCYNYGQLLVDAVASVERYAPERCELLVVNDGSTQPRTLEVLEVLRQGGYPILDQPNGGLAAARNRGVGEARGRYILPLDADNRLVPGFLASAIRALDADPGLGVVYGDRVDFGARSGRLRVRDFDLDALLWANFIDACAVYRREVWAACGGYDPGGAVWEDWEFWISAAEKGWRFLRLDEPGFEYRVRPNSMLAVAEREGLRRAVREHIYRKHRRLYAERLEEVLMAGQAHLLEISRDAIALRASRDRLQSELDALAASVATIPAGPAKAAAPSVEDLIAARELERLREEVAALRQESTALGQEVTALRQESTALSRDAASLRGHAEAKDREVAALQRELAAWGERVAFMEGTRAWRWRGALVRLKRRLRATH
ncbi:MAG TPA: glycosyltransferase [Thermoanaerobaculia bacterium]|jgi:glycosyltransferase involved in cell wall biosynthesis